MKNIPNISFEESKETVGFELLELVELFARMPNLHDHSPTRPHRISFYALLLVTKGIGKHFIDLKEYDLLEGTVLKIAKGQVHAFQDNPQYEGCLIIFTEDFVLNHFSKSSLTVISQLYNYHISTPNEFNKNLNDDFLEQLKTELKSKNTFAQSNIVAAILDLYLLRLERFSQGKNLQPYADTKHYRTFMQFKDLVEIDYKRTRNVKDYAEKLFVSSKHLNQVVQKYTLNTAKMFIDDYIILEIKRTIVSTDKSLKEIAFDTGFDEVTNFSKFFKNKMGMSPKNFRTSQE